MSFAQEVKDGLNAFVAMTNATKSSPYEDYMQWKMQNDPMYKAAQAANEDAHKQGYWGPNEQPSVIQRLFHPSRQTMAPAINTAGTPAPDDYSQMTPEQQVAADAAQASQGAETGGYSRGGVIHAKDGAAIQTDPNYHGMTDTQRNRERQRLNEEFGRRDTPETGGTPDLDAKPPGPGNVDVKTLHDKIIKNAAEIGQAIKLLSPPDQSSTMPGALTGQQPGASATPPPGAGPTPQPPGTPPFPQRVFPPYAPPGPQAGPPAPTFSYPGQGAAQAPVPPPAAPGTPTPPPPTAAPAAPPVGVGTGVAPGGGPQPATAPGGAPPPTAPGPQGGIENPQQRVAACNPDSDLVNPQTGATMPRRMTPQGPQATPYPQVATAAEKQYNDALAGAVHFASWLTRQNEDHPHNARDTIALHHGVGAMPASEAADINQHWNNGGRLTPGQALTRYMVFKYNSLVAQGATPQANQMAFEIVQRLNIEASTHAENAVQQVKQGNLPGAVKSLQASHDFAPDGRTLLVSKDGTHMIVQNDFNGGTSQPIPVTPQTILAAALGLRNGTSMWNHLAARAQLHVQGMKGYDRDAEGRALRNEKTRLEIEQKRRKLAGGGGGGGGTSPQVAQMRELLSDPKAPKAQEVHVTVSKDDD